jgi:DNA repair protein RecO
VKQYNDTAIVLSRLDYGERDRILTLLSREHGKLRVIAKGVRSAKSRLAGGIELFSQSQIGVVEGRGSLGTLTSSRLEVHYGNITKDINKTMMAYDFLKAVGKITEDGTGQDYYDVLAKGLVFLDKTDFDARIVQTWIDMQILQNYGTVPNLRTDDKDKLLTEAENYQFDYDRQCFVSDSNGSFTANHVKLLRLIVSGSQPPKVNIDEKTVDSTANLIHGLMISNVLDT